MIMWDFMTYPEMRRNKSVYDEPRLYAARERKQLCCLGAGEWRLD